MGSQTSVRRRVGVNSNISLLPPWWSQSDILTFNGTPVIFSTIPNEGLSHSDTCAADLPLKKHVRLMRGSYEPTTMDCRYTRIQDGCVIFKEIFTWSLQMMRSVLRWLKEKSRSVLSLLYVLRSVSRLLDLTTWKGSKLSKKNLFASTLKVPSVWVDICIMSQCCVFVIHCSLVSEVPTERAMD